MKKIGILFGGASSEYEVSLLSAASVIRHFPTTHYELVLVGITRDGRWFYYKGGAEEIERDTWWKGNNITQAMIDVDPSCRGLFLPGTGERIGLDAVFPVLHGKNGEDGTIQGLLQLAGIPCVGCGTASSAVCMDKYLTKMILENAGVLQAKWTAFSVHDYQKDPRAVEQTVFALGFPFFLKPANAGSSVGITKVVSPEAFGKAISEAAKIDEKMVAEEAVAGREIECAVFGKQEPFVSVAGEIIPDRDFYDYDAKYHSEGSELVIPAPLTLEKTREVREMAEKVFRVLDCTGMARVDFFIRESDDVLLLNEPNTIPGFTSISMYAKLMEKSGVPYEKLLGALVELALTGKENLL